MVKQSENSWRLDCNVTPDDRGLHFKVMLEQLVMFQVEVIRARGLVSQPGRRTLPAPYIKVYLVSGKRCIAKAKTSTARRTLDPLYQQTLTFRENFKGCVLQVSLIYT